MRPKNKCSSKENAERVMIANVYLVNHKNMKIGGIVEVDEETVLYPSISTRCSTDQQLKTFLHELNHLEHNNPIELVEVRASGKVKPDKTPTKTPITHLEVYSTTSKKPHTNCSTFFPTIAYYPPVKIKRSRMYKGLKRTPKINYLERTWHYKCPAIYRRVK